MDVVVAHTDLGASEEAGIELGTIVYEQLGNNGPDALLVFASPEHDHTLLLQAIEAACQPRTLVGSCTKFSDDNPPLNSVRVMALRSDDMDFRVEIARGLENHNNHLPGSLASSLVRLERWDYAYRSAMVLTDAAAPLADSLVQELNLKTAGSYQLMGGGAGGLPLTHVFYGTEVVTNAVVVLEILSNKPLDIGIGTQHGWEPASDTMRVTEVDGTRLVSLDAMQVLEVFDAHAAATGQEFDWESPESFFLSNAIGIESGGGYHLRIPCKLNMDGTITFAAEIPLGSSVCIMRARSVGALQTVAAPAKLPSTTNEPCAKASVFFNCVAGRLSNGQNFDQDLKVLRDTLLPPRFSGQWSTRLASDPRSYNRAADSKDRPPFHNCNAVSGIIP